MAKVAPGEFVQQVQTEFRKTSWPTRRETAQTAIFVAILTTVLSLFFFGMDTLFSKIVEALLKLVA